MPTDRDTVLATCATGKRGPSYCAAPVADGSYVRALVRNANTVNALALCQTGAEVVIGDMDERESLHSGPR
jgi:uncharacterized protein YbjT (DUF2867 family)